MTYIAIELLKHLMATFHNEQCSLDSIRFCWTEIYIVADSFTLENISNPITLNSQVAHVSSI